MFLACIAALAVLVGPAVPAKDHYVESLDALVSQALPEGDVDTSAPGDRTSFLEVLSSEMFLHAEVGPFDVFVMQVDGYASASAATKALNAAVKGLEPVVPVMRRYFGGEDGLIAGRRLPIVLTHADPGSGEHSFDQLVALLDWAEDDYSGWKPAGNPIWTPELRGGVTVRTWEVQLFNLRSPAAADHGTAFFEHGLGYYSLAHVSARVLRQGAWGLVPPWLAQGLIDELDIEAYGEAWVGGDWWERQTAGWYREGWSGFVPQGSSPPPPVTGPPADLAVTVKDSGDSWQHRANSGNRHWNELVADRDSEAPASFQFMAENESFLPRDRAYARCMLHLMLSVARDANQPPLTELLDRVPATPPSGMPDAEPITVLVSRALGGVPAVSDLEAMPMSVMLDEIGHPEITEQVEKLGADDMLDLADHREQAEWLYRQPLEEMDWDTRNELWRLILEAEYYQQLAEWELIGASLDRAANAAFGASATYPKRDATQNRVRKAYWDALQVQG